jgi:hypothetical protein
VIVRFRSNPTPPCKVDSCSSSEPEDDEDEDDDEEEEEAAYMAGAVALLRSCACLCATFAAWGTEDVDDDAVLSLWFGEFAPDGGTSTGEPV